MARDVATKLFIQIFKKFGIVRYKKLMFELEFCENQCSGRHSLLWAVNENLSFFLYFLCDLDEIKSRSCPQKFIS